MYTEHRSVHYQQPYYQQPYVYYYKPVRKYGFWNFVLDVTMLALTWGLWIIWILVREIRYSR